MKFVYLFLVSFLISFKGVAMEININIKNIEVDRGGNLMVFIFKKEGFPTKHEKSVQQKTVSASKDSAIVTFEIEDEKDELAFKVLHDEDMNGKTSKNWTGIWPREGLGFSNGQKMGIFGPPNFKKSKLKFDQYSQGVELIVTYP
jgi:uncharacterized protein (DUF2141 family)